MPTFDDMVADFELSRATMQLAIRQLRSENFVYSENRKGLFVSPHPPHLFRYALVFPSAPGEETWTRFFASLQSETQVVARQWPGVSLVSHYDVRLGGDPSRAEALLKELSAYQLGGIILTRGTAHLLERPELRESRAPIIAIHHEPEEAPGCPIINSDSYMFLDKGLVRLAERGRKRIAIIKMGQRIKTASDYLRKRGFETRDHWLCEIGHGHEGTVAVVVKLLFDYPPEEQPDGLVIATDALVEETLAALYEIGLIVGRDLDIIAHCNWPWPVKSPFPMERIGYHTHDFLNHALDYIQRLQRGDSVPEMTLVPALGEQETASTSGLGRAATP